MSAKADKHRAQKWERKLEKERSDTRREAPRAEAHRREMGKIARALGMEDWYV